MLRGKERVASQMRVHHRENLMRDRDRALGIGLRIEQRDYPRRGGTETQFARRDRKPALQSRRADGIGGQPRAVGRIAPHEIDQDRIAVGEREIAVL